MMKLIISPSVSTTILIMTLFAASTLQRRWKNLRDCYTRELLRIMKLKASGKTDRKRGYIYYKQLSFLRKVVKPTKRSVDISANEREALKNVLDAEEVLPEADDPLEEIDYEQSKNLEEEFQESTDNYNTLPGGIAEEDFSLPPSYSADTNHIYNGEFSKNRQSSFLQPKGKKDCDTLFLMSLVGDLRRIPEEHKLEVKIELMQVLKKAKRKIVKKKASQQNSQQQHQQKMTIKDEAESESLDDVDEHSLDSFREPNTPEQLDANN